MELSTYTSAISAALLLGLLAVYLRVYRDTRAQFSLGLVIFACVLFAQNIVAVYSFMTMAPYIMEPFMPFLLTMNLAEAFGVLVLLRTTTR